MKLSEELKWRGFINQTTFEDVSAIDGQPLAFYFGVDPSAFGMQIGNLASAMMVRHFINHGHKAYLLVGGATGLIGDPDGRSKSRDYKTDQEINLNKQEIIKQYSNVFSGKDFTVVDNYDWFKDMKYLDFLRIVGNNVPVNQMLGREFVQSRLSAEGAGISYAEFSYSLMQAYDFLYLNQKFGVSLQLCGADQWGNCIAGVDLIRRAEGKEVNVYSGPLVINKATGKKFGKSEVGAVWLNEDKTSVYQFYQFWLNVDDEGVIDYLKYFTLLDKSEIDQLAIKTKQSPELRLAQKALAGAVTELVHGKERLDGVMRVTAVLFGEAEFDKLTEADYDILAKEIPVSKIKQSLINILLESNLVASGGEAKRLIKSSAISINGQKVSQDLIIDQPCLVKKGKNSFVLVR